MKESTLPAGESSHDVDSWKSTTRGQSQRMPKRKETFTVCFWVPPINDIYTAADAGADDGTRKNGLPGEYPFTRAAYMRRMTECVRLPWWRPNVERQKTPTADISTCSLTAKPAYPPISIFLRCSATTPITRLDCRK